MTTYRLLWPDNNDLQQNRLIHIYGCHRWHLVPKSEYDFVEEDLFESYLSVSRETVILRKNGSSILYYKHEIVPE